MGARSRTRHDRNGDLHGANREPDEYQVVCGIEGHLEGGMRGELVVK